ncbi:hypothetical protein L7F22_017280 [Adiantum nelumboides]|nr:hypothetical protein [Adiantum nelumboides]
MADPDSSSQSDLGPSGKPQVNPKIIRKQTQQMLHHSINRPAKSKSQTPFTLNFYLQLSRPSMTDIFSQEQLQKLGLTALATAELPTDVPGDMIHELLNRFPKVRGHNLTPERIGHALGMTTFPSVKPATRTYSKISKDATIQACQDLLHSDHPDYARNMELWKAKEFSSSLKAYNKAINMYKDSAALYANRAAANLKMNRYEDAYADCCEALKLEPRNVKVLMRRAKASLEMSKLTNALIDLQEALKFDPTNEEALSLKRNFEDAIKKRCSSNVALPDGRRLAIEEIDSTGTEVRQQKNLHEKEEQEDSQLLADQWHAKGNTFFAEKNFREACDCYAKSLTFDPYSVKALCNKSLCGLKLENYIAAEVDASKALVIDSHCIKAFHHRGLARRALGKLTDALEDLQEVLRAFPGDKTVAAEIEVMMMEHDNGRMLLSKREGPMIIEEINEDVAQEHHEENITLSKHSKSQDSALPVLSMSGHKDNIQIQTSSITDTVSFMETASEHICLPEASVIDDEVCNNRKPPQVQKCFLAKDFVVGNVNVLNEEGYGGVGIQNQICSSSVNSGHVQKENIELGHSASGLEKRPSHALQTKGRDCSEERHKALEERLKGNECYKMGNIAAAIDCYSKSLALDQTVAATYTNRALCHLKLKEPIKAKVDCTLAIQLEPKNSKAYFRRAMARKEVKDIEDALEDLKMFLSLCPNDKSVHSLIKELEGQGHQHIMENGSKEQATLSCEASFNVVMSSAAVSEILKNPDKWRTVSVPSIPRTAVEFERCCLDLLKQPSVLKEYIQSIKTSLYPNIFKEDLSARILKLVIVIMKENNPLFQCKEMLDILQGLTKVNRFEITVMLLDKEGKEALRELFRYLKTAAEEFTADTNSLKCKYLCS